ncbi:MAG: curli assembly protein CsgF [Paracoccaceae bacterium]|jgi:curli production assembly/transport component CsgF|nr:curli assembly protein CsgF [Paracoccaceae bacterium]
MRGYSQKIWVLCLVMFGHSARATDLGFRFHNPSFGGDPMAASHFLNLLEAQKIPTVEESDTIAQFTEDLERRLLSGLATEISSQIFGQDDTTEGAFVVGGLAVQYETVGTDVVVTLTDGISTTEIIVPGF